MYIPRPFMFIYTNPLISVLAKRQDDDNPWCNVDVHSMSVFNKYSQ